MKFLDNFLIKNLNYWEKFEILNTRCLTVGMLICVDENNNQIGLMEKLYAHKLGILHRAFSIFIFRENKKNELELLIQKRAKTKYHTPGLWSNTCCSHPVPNMDIEICAYDRLKEEMGFNCYLKHVGHFIYRAELENGLIENEYDYIFIGSIKRCKVKINPNEADDFCWMDVNRLKKELFKKPTKYTPWFKEALSVALRGYDDHRN